jgi:hypothetical protein
MSGALLIGGVVVLIIIVAIILFSGIGRETKNGSSSSGSPSPSPSPSPSRLPCAGLTDTSLASSVSVPCLRKILTDEGCTSSGTVWPQDDYDGWWVKSPQGATTVGCDDQGTPCGAGNFATVKSNIKFWATSPDPMHVAGCGRAPQYYLGDAGCTADESGPKAVCRNNAACTAVAQQPNGCWHTLQNQGSYLKDLTGYSKIILKKDA